MKNVYQLLDLKGQTAIITGGAAGIQLQMSYALGEAGEDLVLASEKLSAVWKLRTK